MTKTQAEKISKLLIDIDIEVSADELEDLEDQEKVYEYLDEHDHFNVEIIYHSNAIEYLSEHDNSLTESLALASDAGCTLENLNSEILASLLASQNTREAYNGIIDDIEEVLNSEEKYENGRSENS